MKDHIVWTNAHNVRIEVPLASIGMRAIAYLLDSVIRWTFIIVLGYVLIQLLELEPSPWTILILASPYLFYSLFFEMFNDGQSPGKRICHLKVTSPHGRPAGGQSFFMRWVFRLIDFNIITPVVALVAAASSEKRQRIGDMVADTVVVDTKVLRQALYETYTAVPSEYEPIYPAAKNLHRDDIALIKDIMKMEMGIAREAMVLKLYNKLLAAHHIVTTDPPRRVLFSLVQDYNYFQLNAEK